MAHVPGEKAAASLMKSAAGAGMTGSAMGEMGKVAGASSMMEGGMSAMMGGGMGPMMGEGMGAMMGGGMGSMMNMSHGVVAGAAATAGARGTVGKIIRHPVVLIGLGVAFGYLLHKYRKQIISWAGE